MLKIRVSPRAYARKRVGVALAKAALIDWSHSLLLLLMLLQLLQPL